MPDLPTVQLKFFAEGSDEARETLFASYVPVSMVREMLEEKKLIAKGYNDL